MNVEQTIHRNFAANNLNKILRSMSSVDNNQKELIFPAVMIKSYWSLWCYQFAHDLEGRPYMRARINEFTIEYLEITNPENENCEEALVCQISTCGQRIYDRPDKPVGTIRIL